VPAKKAVIQLVSRSNPLISTMNSLAIPAQAGTDFPARVAHSQGARTQKTLKFRCLWNDGSRPAPGWRDLRRKGDNGLQPQRRGSRNGRCGLAPLVPASRERRSEKGKS